MNETEKTTLKWFYNELDKLAGEIGRLQNDALTAIGENDDDDGYIVHNPTIDSSDSIIVDKRILYKVAINYPFVVYFPQNMVIPLTLYDKYTAKSRNTSDPIFDIYLCNKLLTDARTESLTENIICISVYQEDMTLHATLRYKIGFVEFVESLTLDLTESELKWRKVTNE